jgi:hypothetical protein
MVVPCEFPPIAIQSLTDAHEMPSNTPTLMPPSEEVVSVRHEGTVAAKAGVLPPGNTGNITIASPNAGNATSRTSRRASLLTIFSYLLAVNSYEYK